MTFLSVSTPFLADYWPVLVSVLLLILTISLFVPSLLRKDTSVEKGQLEGSTQEDKRRKVCNNFIFVDVP